MSGGKIITVIHRTKSKYLSILAILENILSTFHTVSYHFFHLKGHYPYRFC